VPRNESAPVADVLVWHACLDVSDDVLEILDATLSVDERGRSARYVFDRDRRRFIAARGILRRILGARLGVDAQHLRFAYGDRGKPSLRSGPAAEVVRFNLAHSHGHGLFAVSDGAELGVDIELIRPLPGAAAIAERFFSQLERSLLFDLPLSQREVAFFLCWTRKEACLKALGAGLAHPLDAFSVSLDPGAPARVLEAQTTEIGSGWPLHDLSRLPEYAAAIVVNGNYVEARVEARELGTDCALALLRDPALSPPIP
jgi:4'-phosphopantetheinyl transferase